MPRPKNRLLNQSDLCLVLQPSLVQMLGRSATLFLQQVHYALTHPNFGKEIDGCRWVYHTLEEWAQKIKIFSKSTLKRSIAHLKKVGVLCVKHLSFKKSDRTNWYSIDYEALSSLIQDPLSEEKSDLESFERETLEAPQNEALKDQNPELKMSSSWDQNEPMYSTETTYKKDLNNNLNKSEECLIERDKKKFEKETKLEENSLKEKLNARDLLEIWNQETNQTVVMTKERARHLMAVLQRCFNNSKEEWTQYCKTLISSDFLSGRTHHKFDLRLDWAIRFQTVQKVKEKAYGVKDIDSGSQILLETLKNKIKESSSCPKEREIRDLLLSKFGEKTYKSWFENVQIFQQEDFILFKTESLFAKNYLESKFKYPLQDIMLTSFEIVG